MFFNLRQKGFTLIELIMVIVIIGILLSLGTTRYVDTERIANRRVLQANHQLLLSSLKLIEADNSGNIPSDLTIEKLENQSGISDGSPKGALYTYEDGKITTKVTDAAIIKNHYPKTDNKNPDELLLEDDINTGKSTLVPDEKSGYWN